MSAPASRRRRVLCKRTPRRAEGVSYESHYTNCTARGSAAPKLAKRGLRPAPDQVCYLSAYRIGDRHLRESVPEALGHFYQPLPDQGLSELCVIGQFLEIA